MEVYSWENQPFSMAMLNNQRVRVNKNGKNPQLMGRAGDCYNHRTFPMSTGMSDIPIFR